MAILTKFAGGLGRVWRKGAIGALILIVVPGFAAAEILWSGDFETGNFLQWHRESDKSVANYSQIPEYGRPPKAAAEGDSWPLSYYGDGSLLRIATSPVRQGRYSARFTVKNSIFGAEPYDCDYPFPTCERRRTELTVQGTLPKVYNALPYMSERWLSVSHYFPAGWATAGGGFGPTVFQIKPLNEYGASGTLAIELHNGAWRIWHRWENEGGKIGQLPWQQQMFYAGNEDGGPYPRRDYWPDGTAHFPEIAKSHAALQSVNIGGWTDWVINIRFDARGAGEGGTGFLRVWKREDSGPWVQVLDIFPGKVTRGGVTFDHGIGYKAPATSSNPGGFGIKAGMYMDKSRVWSLLENRVMYNDNIKVGNAATKFSMMSPDGSSPISDSPVAVAPPNPPKVSNTN